MPTDKDNKEYLLANSPTELERLRLQARTWEPEAINLLNLINPQKGGQFIDLGCGAMGILEPLSQKAGEEGQVIGLDNEELQLRGARS